MLRKDEIVGKPHKLALMNSTIPGYRSGHRRRNWSSWQVKVSTHNLVWMCFGVRANEVGYVQDVNRSNCSEDTEVLTENGWKACTRTWRQESGSWSTTRRQASAAWRCPACTRIMPMRNW